MSSLSEDEITECLRTGIKSFLRDESAVEWCMDLWYVIHVWDDLIDKDKQRSDMQVNKAFYMSLLGLQENKFFEAFKSELRPLLRSMIYQWMDANVLEHGADHQKHAAYGLRSFYYQVVKHCALLLHGVEFRINEGPAMQGLYGERLEDFVEEMKNA